MRVRGFVLLGAVAVALTASGTLPAYGQGGEGSGGGEGVGGEGSGGGSGSGGTTTTTGGDGHGPGVWIVESGGFTGVHEEGPTSDTYEVVLCSQPSSNVLINISTDGQTSVAGQPDLPLVFTPSDWDIPQVVVVTAVDDDLVEGRHGSTITHTAQCSDPDYNGIPINDVVAIVDDNDLAAPNVAPTVVIISPEHGEFLNAGEPLTITARASDSDGVVTQVEFYRDDGRLEFLGFGTETSPGVWQYTFTPKEPSIGPFIEYDLIAYATDDDGAVGVSVPVLICILQSPDQALFMPAPLRVIAALSGGCGVPVLFGVHRTWQMVGAALPYLLLVLAIIAIRRRIRRLTPVKVPARLDR